MLSLTLRLDRIRDAYYAGRREVPAIERDIAVLAERAGKVVLDQGILEECLSQAGRFFASDGPRNQLNEFKIK